MRQFGRWQKAYSPKRIIRSTIMACLIWGSISAAQSNQNAMNAHLTHIAPISRAKHRHLILKTAIWNKQYDLQYRLKFDNLLKSTRLFSLKRFPSPNGNTIPAGRPLIWVF